MRTLLFLLLLLSSLALPVALKAQNREIRFEKGTWQQALEKAKRGKKMIYLDGYTTWCGYCKLADAKIFTNDTVADFYNTHFICVKMDMEKGEGLLLAKKYQIRAFPYMLYMDAQGEVVHRICGASPPAEFVQQGKDALSPATQFSAAKKAYANGLTDPVTAYRFFKMMDNACLPAARTAEKYLAMQKDSVLMVDDIWPIMNDYAGYGSKAFGYLEKHADFFKEKYGSYPVEKKLNDVYAEKLNVAYKRKDMGTYTVLKRQFLKLNTKDRQQVIDRAELKMAKLPNNDIEEATVIRDSIVGPTNVSLGSGAKLDRFGEGNSAWFKLNIDHDTLLTFDIIPVDSLDDYDFFLFKCPEEDCIPYIQSNKKMGDRTCLSYCTSKSGMTGLSRYAGDPNIGPGPGPAYAAGMPVKAGETYYLMVDFPKLYTTQGKRPLGFTIYFYDSWPRRYPVVLQNIFFESNKAVLLKESFAELDKLAADLKKSYSVIEVRGHTDNRGRESDNQLLSVKRAEAVVEYLKSKNIPAKRLFYKGFGSKKPLASNAQEAGRKKNRRVEFVIVLN